MPKCPEAGHIDVGPKSRKELAKVQDDTMASHKKLLDFDSEVRPASGQSLA